MNLITKYISISSNDKSPMNFLSPSSKYSSMMYLCRIWVKGWLRYLQSFFLHNFNSMYEEKNTANQRRRRNKLGEGYNFKNYVGFRRIFVRYKKTNPFLTKPWMWPLNWPNPTISNRSGANNCFGHPTFLLGHPTTQWKS